MRFDALATFLKLQAPRILGAFFTTSLLLTNACKESSTPDWSNPAPEAASNTEGTARSKTSPTAKNESPPAQPTAPAAKNKADSGLRFITYNLENWLTADRYVGQKQVHGAPKPESEKQAVVQILARHSPDVIGLCEIGTPADLAEIQERLKNDGLNLPHTHFTGGSDPVRHLGLLSKFPILSTTKPSETTYQLDGQTFAINRGILDATIEARGKSYRFIGVHLKSKRDVQQGDQEAMRLHEARLLRRHVDSVLRENAGGRLVVYGDFNDTRSSPTVKTITGKYNDPSYLTAIPAKDSRQMAWTHYWALHDIYSRIDFITVTQALRKEVDFPAAKVIDDGEWNDASDHRPVIAVFK